MKDPYGFTTVDLRKVGYKEEPFVLADQVSQVFYVHDTRNKKRHVVRPGKRRVVSVENFVDEDYGERPKSFAKSIKKKRSSQLVLDRVTNSSRN